MFPPPKPKPLSQRSSANVNEFQRSFLVDQRDDNRDNDDNDDDENCVPRQNKC